MSRFLASCIIAEVPFHELAKCLLKFLLTVFLLLAAPSTSALPLNSVCSNVGNSSLCLSVLSSYSSPQPFTHLQDLTAFVVSLSLTQVNASYSLARYVSLEDGASVDYRMTLEDCLELMDDSRTSLQGALEGLIALATSAKGSAIRRQVVDVRVKLSESLTYMETCWEELAENKGSKLDSLLHHAGQPEVEPLISMALSLAEKLQQPGGTSALYDLPQRHR
ncbi:hypothetical protein KP509_16G062400 [Ceratopteris richardii]|uniref:Pectinesterase inhibitor domain-containing protein n=1 Tax=Ceratopteris richardii TaxID=49495 RepID=A0A8T2SZC2_CERRI|nr:hypothetical protein KP509_16G062400 [Ceratopteris richardii]